MPKLEAKGKRSIGFSLFGLVFLVPAYLSFLADATAGFLFGAAFVGAAVYLFRLGWMSPLGLTLTEEELEVVERGRKRSLRRKDISDLVITRTTVVRRGEALTLLEFEVLSGQDSFATWTSAIEGGSVVAACIQKGTLDPSTKLDLSKIERRVLSA